MLFGDFITSALAAASSFAQGLLPYSTNELRHTDDKHNVDFYQRNLKTIGTIYNLTVWPHNLPIITNGSSAVPKGLFAPNATGRVSPLGNFTGFEDSIEYFFALALVPSLPAYAVFSKASVIEFSSGCPEVAASVAYLETRVDNVNLTNNGQYLSTLKQVAFWRFDDDGAVTAYDACIPNLSDWDFLAEGRQNISNPFIQELTIQYLCPLIMQRCQGKDQQYTDNSQCIQTLTGKTFGDYNDVWSDSVVCRMVHIILALVRPDVHCPHVGPTGGMKCVDYPYNDAYFYDEQLFGQPEGQTFICPAKKGCH